MSERLRLSLRIDNEPTSGKGEALPWFLETQHHANSDEFARMSFDDFNRMVIKPMALALHTRMKERK